jgi:YD repeat-containing protein
MKFRLLLLSVILIGIKFNGFCQGKDKPFNIPSPNASSLGLYGNYEVDLFTGTPNISIPLYELVEGDIRVPISLNYHASSVKVKSHPSWVGLGWSLNVGGAIIRTQKGYMDEVEGAEGVYFHGSKLGFYDQYARLQGDDWASTNKLIKYADDAYSVKGEVEADEFYFSFLGYSGKFYRNEQGGWTVISDQDIKVQNVEFAYTNSSTGNVIRESIRSKMPDGVALSKSVRYFHSFTLVTTDGFMYKFGGKDVSSTGSDANEYSINYGNQLYSFLIPTTFNLVKITSPKGYSVTFNYEEGNINCAISHDFYYSDWKIKDNLNYWTAVSCGYRATATNGGILYAYPDGNLIFPVYLRSITTGNKSTNVYFTKSESKELRYSDNYLSLLQINKASLGLEPFSFVYFTNYSELKWYKLDNISISSAFQNISYNFSYIENNTERLKLSSLKETVNAVNNKPAYEFFYNPNKLPYYEGNNEDHWGYHNGLYNIFTPDTPTPTKPNDYFALREPDLTGNKQKYEILEKIVFPTGGYSIFEYEPHRYYKYIDQNRDLSSVTENKITCGLRIKKINSYDGDNSLVSSKQYYYLKGYKTNVDINTLSSSGILSSIPKYFYDDYKGKAQNGFDFTYDFFSTNGLIPASSVTEGSHIGYSEVAEVSLNGSGITNGYTIHKYSNFDTDPINCLDEYPINSISGERTPYFPYSNNVTSRGKKMSESVYTSDNKLLKQINYVYNKSSAGYLRSVEVKKIGFCGINTDAVFGTAYKRFLYRYNLIGKEVIEYDTNTTTFKKTSQSYTYNSNNFLEEETTTDSRGNIYKVKYKYPLNYTSALQGSIRSGVIDAMVMRNMLNYPIEKTTLLNNKVISSQLTSYTCKNCISTTDPNNPFSTILSGGMILPYQNYNVETTTSIDNFVSATYNGSFQLDSRMKLSETFEAYDNLGNLTQYKENQNGISSAFIYDYLPLVPIARIDNANFSDVAYTSFETSNLGNWYYNPSSTVIPISGGKTGTNCFTFPNTTIKISKANLDPSKIYKVSYWAKGNGTSGGSIGVNQYFETIPSSSTWVYVEKIISGVSTIQISSNSTSISLDELRLCPLDAQMTTYTHKPLVGITSVNNPDGTINYYDYDGFGRLKAIKDEQGNLLKIFDYKYSKL